MSTAAAAPVSLRPRGDRSVVDDDEARRLIGAIERGTGLPTEWFTDPAIFPPSSRGSTGGRGTSSPTSASSRAGRCAAPASSPACRSCSCATSDGSIRGFVNICRHRGHPVVLEAGNSARFVPLPRLDLRPRRRAARAPRADGDPEFDPSRLRPRPDAGARVGADGVGQPRPRRARRSRSGSTGCPSGWPRSGLRRRRMHASASSTRGTIDANWKVFQDNTIECYHCPTTHPELAGALEMKPDAAGDRASVGRYWIHHRSRSATGVTEGVTTTRRPAPTTSTTTTTGCSRRRTCSTPARASTSGAWT